MKSQRDTNNNNNSTAQQQFSSAVAGAAARQNLITSTGTLHHNPMMIDSTGISYPSLLAQNRLQQQQQTGLRYNDLLLASYNKLAQNNNNNNITNGSFQISSMTPAINPFACDSNQLSSAIQACLANAQKFGGGQLPAQIMHAGASNPLLCLQLMNANAMFMQQLATLQNNALAAAVNTTYYDPNRSISKQSTRSHQSSTTLTKQQQTSLPSVESVTDTVGFPRKSQVLQADSNVFVPKTRSMTQEEIGEQARVVYERALHRNQLRQQNNLMKHLYETLNCKQQDSDPVRGHSTNSSSKVNNTSEVPTVPYSTNMTSSSAFDVLDTMIIPSVSSQLCPLIKKPSIDAVLSSSSLLSTDDVKVIGGIDSTLDPGAPVFIPCRIRSKPDEDIDISSSSSDSEFNDFQYLDQFLDEFYDENNKNNNNLIIIKSPSSEGNGGSANKHSANHNALGQGDASDDQQPGCAPIEQTTEQQSSPSVEKDEHQYSIYEMLDRYRNPRCHLVLPEWSRLSLILGNVCSVRSHTYKVKRYFAYRRRLREDQEYLQINAQDSATTELIARG